MKRYIYLTTLCLLGFYASYATNYTWNGSVSNNWATANNWTPAGVPSSGDSVTIDAASYTPVLDMNRSIQLLTVNSGGELDLNGQTLSVSLVSNLIEARLFNGHLESNDFAAESCIFNVSIDVSGGFLQINSNRFNYPVHIIYIGSAISENGGNSFLSTVDILSNSIGDVLFGHENSDIFEDSLKVKVQNAGRVVLADSSEGNIFNGYCFFERLNGSSGAAITIGRLENSAYFNNVIEIASNSSSASITSVSLGLTHCFLDTACIVQVHSNGFNQGLFRISNSIISSAIGITLSNEAGFMAEKESTFRESIQVSAPHIYLHNAHFRGESSFTKTGGGIDFSQGPITANRDIIFTNTGGGDFWINGSKGDMFHANVTLNNTTKGGALMFSAAATESFVEGDVMINSTRGKIALATSSPNSLSILGKVYINADSGSVFIQQTTIEQDGSIEIQSIKGNIHFAGLQYNAVAPFNVNLINGNGFLAMKYCNFQPKVNLTLPSVAIAESVFNDSLTITSGVNGLSSWGGLICHGPVVLNRGYNTGAWNLYGNGHPNTFFKNVEINVNDTNSAPFNFNGQHQFYENLSVHSSQPLQASQSQWSFKGANNQQVNLECDSTIQLEKLTVEKSDGLLTINNDIAVLGELSLTKGVVRVTVSANLQLLSLATVSGGSDSSYVEGFMSKQGTAAFTFPTGGNGSYAPLGIDAVASTCTFKAQYIAEDPDSLYPRSQKDTTLGFINRCGYWNLDRTTGTQNTKVTLGWSNNPCFAPNPADALVSEWSGTKWVNLGNASTFGNASAGSAQSQNNINPSNVKLNLVGRCNTIGNILFDLDTLYTGYTYSASVSPASFMQYDYWIGSVELNSSNKSFNMMPIYNDEQLIHVVLTDSNYCIIRDTADVDIINFEGSAQFEAPIIIKVSDSAFIPTTTEFPFGLVDSDLLEVLDKFDVNVFSQSYPAIYLFPESSRNELDKYYNISCENCNKDSLFNELYELLNHGLEEIIPRCYYSLLNEPNDYLFTQSQTTLWQLDNIDALSAWQVNTGCDNIKIGIVELPIVNQPNTIDLNHQDLDDKIECSSSTIPPQLPHGTFVTGCCAAATNNSIGLSSIGYNTKVQYYNGTYNEILLASANGSKVINCSWISGCSPNTAHQNIINLVTQNGSIVVAGSGNGLTGPNSQNPGTLNASCPNNNGFGHGNGYAYPASYNNVISVTSIGEDNKHFDSFDLTSHSGNDKVDICSPGYQVTSLFPGDSYGKSSGTSFASPIVAGVISLMLCENPCLTFDEIMSILTQTSDPVADQSSYPSMLGSGKINAGSALNAVSSYGQSQTVLTNTQETINGYKLVSDDWIVENGAVLKLSNAQINFTKSGSLIVNPGAVLYIENSILTSTCAMWKGIRVLGNAYLGQGSISIGSDGIPVLDSNGFPFVNSSQGVVILIESKIENAEEGVFMGAGLNGLEYDKTGGIIYALNSEFRNNFRSVAFNPYKPYSISKFVNCKFICDNHLKNPDYYNALSQTWDGPESFVSMWDVKNIRFIDNTFENDQDYVIEGDCNTPDVTKTFTRLKRADGLGSYDARFIVTSTDPDHPTEPKRNEFKGLTRGIWVRHSYPSASNFLWCFSAHFDNVQYGITTDNSRSAFLRDNSFLIPDGIGATSNPNYEPYGILLNGYRAHTLANNTFEAITGNGGYSNYGLVVKGKNGFQTSGTIINNSFNKLPTSFQAEISSPSLFTNCNEFTNTARAWNLFPENEAQFDLNDHIFQDQGTGCLSTETRVGNKFFDDNDHIWSRAANQWTYFSRESQQIENPQFFIGEGITQQNGVLQPCGVSNDPCGSSGGSGGNSIHSIHAKRIVAKTEIQAITQTLNGWVEDGGNTILRLNAISDTTINNDSLSILLRNSSPLSDTVLAQCFSGVRSFSAPQVLSIAERNLPCTQTAYNVLKAFIDADLREYSSIRDTLLTKLQAYNPNYTTKVALQRESMALTGYWLHSIDESMAYYSEKDSLLALIPLYRDSLQNQGFEKELLVTYITLDSLPQARYALNALSLTNQNDSLFANYTDLYLDMKEDSITWLELDSAQTHRLTNISRIPSDIQSYALVARSLRGDTAYHLYPTIDSEPQARIAYQAPESPSELKQASNIHIFPNPNQGQFTLEMMHVNSQACTVNFIDLTGRTLTSFKFTTSENERHSESIQLGQLSNGIYLCQVYLANGEPIGFERIVISK